MAAIAILDIVAEQGKALAKKHDKSYPGKVIFIKCDVSKEDEIAKAFDEVVEKFKQVDVIVNNAGIMVDAPAIWRTACIVNWVSCQGIKHISKGEGGVGNTIVNYASIADITKNPFMPIYCGSKSAVVHFSQCLAFIAKYTNAMALWEAKGKTFLITGGASGLGARYVGTFMEKEAKSIAILDIAVDQGKALVENYDKTHPGQVIFIKCDMSKQEDIDKAFQEVIEKFQRLDVIINNAGIMVDAPGVWKTASDVNFQGLVALSLKGIHHMDKSEGGAGGIIVNIASTVALVRVPFLPIYSGAKSAVMHFCRCITVDPFYANTGVRILCMCFGPTDTPLLHNLEKRVYNPKYGKEFAQATPENGVYYQKVESAVSSVEHMMAHGACGSVWLSNEDKPAKDITPIINQAYGLLEKEVYGFVP